MACQHVQEAPCAHAPYVHLESVYRACTYHLHPQQACQEYASLHTCQLCLTAVFLIIQGVHSMQEHHKSNMQVSSVGNSQSLYESICRCLCENLESSLELAVWMLDRCSMPTGDMHRPHRLCSGEAPEACRGTAILAYNAAAVHYATATRCCALG